MRYLAVVLLVGVGCSIADPPAPLVVRPSDLVRCYRDSPIAAGTAYTGQVIRVPLANAELAGNQLVWRLTANSDSPPVIAFDFAGPPPTPSPSLWVEGVCQGRTTDRLRRELPGYDFTIRVTGCRVVEPPGR